MPVAASTHTPTNIPWYPSCSTAARAEGAVTPSTRCGQPARSPVSSARPGPGLVTVQALADTAKAAAGDRPQIAVISAAQMPGTVPCPALLAGSAASSTVHEPRLRFG